MYTSWNEDFLPSLIKNIIVYVSPKLRFHISDSWIFCISVDHYFLRAYCANSNWIISIIVSGIFCDVSSYIAMLVPCLFLFSVLFWLQTNSHGETVRTLYFSYLAVLQKVANHVALLQAASTSKQQVWVGFLNFFVMLFGISILYLV